MPSRPPHPCSYHGCTNLVTTSRCADHQRPEVDVYHHDKAIKQLYNSNQWARIRTNQLTKEPWCAICLQKNMRTFATDVDHITPHRGDSARFFDGPFQSLCHSCHTKKTNEERGG